MARDLQARYQPRKEVIGNQDQGRDEAVYPEASPKVQHDRHSTAPCQVHPAPYRVTIGMVSK